MWCLNPDTVFRKTEKSASVSTLEKAAFMFQLLQSLNTNSFLWHQVSLLFATMAGFCRGILGAISKHDSWKGYYINENKKAPLQAVCYYYC